MQVLFRLILENINHAQTENGRLAVSYDAFAEWGVDRHGIRGALDELEALGFIVCTQKGRRAHGIVPGRVATYRLTFIGTIGDRAGRETDEWRCINAEEAGLIKQRLVTQRRRKRQSVAVEAEGVILPFRREGIRAA